MFKVGFKGITAHGKRFCYGIILMTGDNQVEDIFFPAGQVISGWEEGVSRFLSVRRAKYGEIRTSP